jgi:hypothetical protein
MSDTYIQQDEFIEIVKECNSNPKVILEKYPEYFNQAASIRRRINRYRRSGLLPLESGNKISSGEVLKGSTTHYDSNGNIKQQWVRSDVAKEQELAAFEEAIESITNRINPIAPVPPPSIVNEDTCTLYPLPDLHFGMLVHGEETNHGFNYDLKIAVQWVMGAMEHLVDVSPNSKECVIVDLGDFLHSADDANRTKSGHILDVDGRHAKIMEAALDCMEALVKKALTKHEKVYFYSVKGNHSELTPIAIRRSISKEFKNQLDNDGNLRVIVQPYDRSQQYHHFGKNILGFSHGHELKPGRAEVVMVADNASKFSESEYRYFHFGHFHSNKISEGPICNIEVHKNIIPRDMWAEGMGFRGHIGQAKSITYHKDFGEVGRSIFNIQMRPDLVNKAKSH